MSIKDTENWFKKAVPNPTDDNLQTQVGCHFEELGEMVQKITGQDKIAETAIRRFQEDVEFIATALKTKNIKVSVLRTDRKEFLDALADQVVTATGCAHMAGMNLPEALERVNTSNFSKFDENGNPFFDENGKIVKNKATYVQPDLSGLF